jgi:hypothetical protein
MNLLYLLDTLKEVIIDSDLSKKEIAVLANHILKECDKRYIVTLTEDDNFEMRPE